VPPVQIRQHAVEQGEQVLGAVARWEALQRAVRQSRVPDPALLLYAAGERVRDAVAPYVQSEPY